MKCYHVLRDCDVFCNSHHGFSQKTFKNSFLFASDAEQQELICIAFLLQVTINIFFIQFDHEPEELDAGDDVHLYSVGLKIV
jgi:hypothetical protein